MDWNDIIKTIGTNAIFLAVLGFVTKSIFSQMLSRDIEKFKIQLQTTHDAELERLKADLGQTSFIKQTKFAALHEKRVEVVAKLYELFVLVELCYRAFSFDSGNPEKSFNDANFARSEFNKYFTQNRIYLSLDLCEKIDNLARDLSRLEIKYAISYGEDVLDPEEVESAKQEVAKKVKNELPFIAKEIESSFRDLLGSSEST
jgi:hypothetical protein